MELYQHQKDFLAQNPNKCSLVWSCGTGKTRTALEWATEYGGVVLIVCPKALKANWKREIEKFIARKTVKIAFTILTKEEFRKFASQFQGVESIIVDEVHNGFLTPNFKSQMSKALRAYIKKHNVPRVLLLSATVYTSSPWNIYNLAYYTGHVWDYMKFKYKFFVEIPMGLRNIWMPKKGIEGELAQLTKQIASVVNIADCMDVPLQNHLEPEYFALTKEQEKAIKDSYDPVPIVRFTKQHEVENGILCGNEFQQEEAFESDKWRRLLDLIEENKKIVIVGRYNLQLEVLQVYCEQFSIPVFLINGANKNRDADCLSAEKSDRCVVLIQSDCGLGFQLPSFELCVYWSMSYSYTSWEQMNGRFLRMDKPSRTTFMYLLTEGESVDQAVYDAVGHRKDFNLELYAKKRS